jgi:hypothetical protein
VPKLRTALFGGAIFTLTALLAPRPAHAETPPKDPMPDYKGTGQKPDGPSPWLWIPRVLAAPLYVISEFGLRQPSGLLIRAADFGNWPVSIYDFFTFNDHKIGIFPTFFVDFGFRPSVGFVFFWNDALANRNELRAGFGTWGPDWINAALLDRYYFERHRSWVGLGGRFQTRSDFAFYGEGPQSLNSNVSRYESTRVEVAPALSSRFFRSSQLDTRIGVRWISYGESTCCGDPSVAERVQNGDYPLPEGFGESRTEGFERLDPVFDSRRPRPAPGSGYRVELHGEPVFEPREHLPRGWIRYGAGLGGALDLTGTQRNLSLMLHAAFADPLVGGIVPFDEQIILGGGIRPPAAFMGGMMRGYRYGRLTGQSALVGQLEYTWPIWVFLDGVAAIEVGNVFGSHLDGFDVDLLRATGVFGMRTNTERDQVFEMLIGTGTRTFRDGAGLESFRFTIGTQFGF